MLHLYDKTKKKIAALVNYGDYCIEHDLDSADKVLSFLMPAKDENIPLIQEECYIRNKKHEFVIKSVLPGEEFEVKAVLNLENLEGTPFQRFESKEQTIDKAINLALVGTGWTLGECNLTKKRTVRMTNSSSLAIIKEMKKVYRADIVFNTLEKTIDIYEKLGSDKGAYLIDSLNLISLDVESNTYDYATRIIPIGKEGLTIESVNGGKNYVENYQYSNKIKTIYWTDERYTDARSLKEDAEAKLKEISKPYRGYSAEVLDLAKMNSIYKDILDYDLGDYITLISKDYNLKEKQRIIKYIEYPEENERNSVDLANATLKFEDIQKEFEDTVDTVDNITTDNGTVDGSKVDSIETEQINNFSAEIGKIVNLEVIRADIQHLKADKADIQSLNAVDAKIGTLEATKANITELNATNANIENLKVNKADITDLNATNGKITILESEVAKIGVIEGNVANIQDIINGNLSSENIQAGAITGDRLNMDTIFVTDANIINVNASKMNTGELNTNKVKIKSEDGGIEIVGATQQFKDKNNKVRIQMGKDTQGNFNFIIRGEDGTSILIDHNGIKEKAITDNLIKESMIAPDVIGEKNINYNSFTTGFNKDTNTSTIKGTKVRLDNQNQTLEVAFTSLKSQADGTKSVTESNTTSINVQQGQINTAIANTKIVKDGKEILLKDDYNTTVQTVNSMKNTISSHTTKIDANTGKITGVESKTNVLERDLNSMSSKLSNTESTVTNHTSQINTAQSTANTAKDKADKAQSDATTANGKIDGLEIGGRNLILGSKSLNNSNFKFLGNGNLKEEVDIESPDGKIDKVVKLTVSQTTNSEIFRLGNVIKKTGIYTFSCWYKSAIEINQNVYFDICDRIVSNQACIATNEWKRLIITSTIYRCDTIYNFVDIEVAKGNSVLIHNPKLECGNKASDYTEAPEDTQTQIETNKDNIVKVNTEITTTKNKVSTIEQNMDSITQRVGSTESTVTNHTATISSHTNSINAVDGKINTAKTDAINTSSNDAKSKADKALADAKSFTNVEVNKVITSTNSKFAEIKTTTDSINLEVNNTKKEVDKVNVKVDGVEVGGRNLIKESNFLATADKNNYAKILPVRFVDNFDFNILINKKITLSYFLNNPGSWVAGPDSYGVRFGIHGSVVWIDKSGKLSSKVEYPFADYLDAKGVINKRVSMTKTFTPPTGYDSIQSISFSFQPYSKPDSLNNEIWKIGLPKLEIGTKNSDWTPAPEDTSQEIIDVTTTKINEAKADIKITTDSIKQSVSNVDSKTTTINNTLNNTNSEVNTLKSKTTTLETNLSGITGRVTNVESSTVTINGEVTSIKSRVQTAEQKLTATSIINTVSEAITGGKAIQGTSTKLTKDQFEVYNSYGKVILSGNEVNTYNASGRRLMTLGSQSLRIGNPYDSSGDTLASIVATKEGNTNIYGTSTRTSVGGTFVSMAFDNNGSDYADVYFRAHRTKGLECYKDLRVYDGINSVDTTAQTFINQFYIIENEINSNRSSNTVWLNYRVGYNGSTTSAKVKVGDGNKSGGLGYLYAHSLINKSAAATLHSDDQVENRGISTYSTTATEHYINDLGSAQTDENCECIILLDSNIQSIGNTKIDYKIFYTINGTEFAQIQTAEKYETFFKVITNKPNIQFDYRIELKVKHQEHLRLETDYEKPIYPNSKNEMLNRKDDFSLLDECRSVTPELDVQVDNNIGMSLLDTINEIKNMEECNL